MIKTPMQVSQTQTLLCWIKDKSDPMNYSKSTFCAVIELMTFPLTNADVIICTRHRHPTLVAHSQKQHHPYTTPSVLCGICVVICSVHVNELRMREFHVGWMFCRCIPNQAVQYNKLQVVQVGVARYRNSRAVFKCSIW